MDTSMRRGFGVVAVCAVAGALVLSGVAHAAQDPDPIITGDCAATLDDDAGPRAVPLTADVGAGAEAPGVLTVGLGSTSKGTNGHDDPLLAAPADEVVEDLGVTGTPVAGDASIEVCEAAKLAVNDVGAVVQNVIPIDDITEPGPDAPPGGLPPEAEPPDEAPGEPPGDDRNPGRVVDPVATDSELGTFSAVGTLRVSGGIDLPTVLDGGLAALGDVTLPPAVAIDPPGQAPGVVPTPDNGTLGDWAMASGAAQAASAAGTQDRLPLLLAVTALAAVAAALSKTLHDRKPA